MTEQQKGQTSTLDPKARFTIRHAVLTKIKLSRLWGKITRELK